MIPGMMNDEDKNKRLGALLSGSLEDEVEESESPGVEKEDLGLDQASEDIMNAFHTKDVSALKSALQSFIELNLAKGEASTAPDEPSESWE